MYIALPRPHTPSIATLTDTQTWAQVLAAQARRPRDCQVRRSPTVHMRLAPRHSPCCTDVTTTCTHRQVTGLFQVSAEGLRHHASAMTLRCNVQLLKAGDAQATCTRDFADAQGRPRRAATHKAVSSAQAWCRLNASQRAHLGGTLFELRRRRLCTANGRQGCRSAAHTGTAQVLICVQVSRVDCAPRTASTRLVHRAGRSPAPPMQAIRTDRAHTKGRSCRDGRCR